ncbi:MAG: prolipoprotein diacylglyceryl transferase [Polyangiaceae bacterium]|nr:prolipoprotein diacylglyceryl transferase [Polyangiaceae bacterium]
MAEPLIPYITIPEIPLGISLDLPYLGHIEPSIKPFGTLVALGVYIGSILSVKRAQQRGLDTKKMSEFFVWVVGIGFVGAHVFDALFYHPQRVLKDPFYLFMLWDGLSSYGGFVGAIIGGLAFKYLKNENILPYADVGGSAFTWGWVFGRAGCAVVHDHPGRLSDAWFAVRYPFRNGVIGRYDLGLYEFFLTIPLAIAVTLLWRGKPRPWGFYVGLICTAYAPVRFFLDFLREEDIGIVPGDPRYGGLTPAQWQSFGLLAIGLYFLLYVTKKNPVSPVPVNAESPVAEAPAQTEASAQNDTAVNDSAPVAKEPTNTSSES